jgi:hypothetical protein
MPQKLTPEIILAAIAGFETQKSHIDSQIAELRSLLDDGDHDQSAASTARSAAVRRRMKLAQQLRWKKIRSESETPSKTAPKPAKRKRVLSAAGRKAISIAAKKRWSAIKAAKQGKSAVAGRKKSVAKKSVAAKKTASEQPPSVSA